MSTPQEQFEAGLTRMTDGMRRAHAAFNEADEGFIEAWRGLQAIMVARGTLEEQMQELRETVHRLETMVLDLSRQIRDRR